MVNGHKREISALSLSRLESSRHAAILAVVGFWDSYEVHVYQIPAFELRCKQAVGSLPRSFLLHDFYDGSSVSHRYLLVGQGDGTATTFAFEGFYNAKDKKYHCDIKEKKDVSLGESPVVLTACSVGGKSAVLASSNRSALFVWGKDSLHHSPVLLKVSHVRSRSQCMMSLAMPS